MTSGEMIISWSVTLVPRLVAAHSCNRPPIRRFKIDLCARNLASVVDSIPLLPFTIPTIMYTGLSVARPWLTWSVTITVRLDLIMTLQI